MQLFVRCPSNPARWAPARLFLALSDAQVEDAAKLVDAMNQLAFSKEGSPSSRYLMLADLLDRHSGKPTQAYEQAGPEGGPVVTKVIHEYHPGPSKGPPG